MTEHIVNQPLKQVTIYQCPQCSRLIRDVYTHQPYPCPWGCGSTLSVLRTEYDAQGEYHGASSMTYTVT
jgi:DNA-directed RNA polymerase subunit RPC12/RpoP